jgi:hypothetical protein
LIKKAPPYGAAFSSLHQFLGTIIFHRGNAPRCPFTPKHNKAIIAAHIIIFNQIPL